MTTAEQVVAEIRTLPEVELREVLDFVGYLKARHGRAVPTASDGAGFGAFIGRWQHSARFADDPLTLQRRMRDEWHDE